MDSCSKYSSVLYSSACLACPAASLACPAARDQHWVYPFILVLLGLLRFFPPLHFSLSDLFIIDLLELCTPCAGCSTIAHDGFLKPIIPSLRSIVLHTGTFYVQTLYLELPVSTIRWPKSIQRTYRVKIAFKLCGSDVSVMLFVHEFLNLHHLLFDLFFDLLFNLFFDGLIDGSSEGGVDGCRDSGADSSGNGVVDGNRDGIVDSSGDGSSDGCVDSIDDGFLHA